MKKHVIAFVITMIVVSVMSTAGVVAVTEKVSAASPSVARPAPTPTVRTFKLIDSHGKVYGTCTVNMCTGKFLLRCVDGDLRPGVQYFLKYHVNRNGNTGAVALATVWSHRLGCTPRAYVYAEGTLSCESLGSLKMPGALSLGPFMD